MDESLWQLENISLGDARSMRLRDVTVSIEPGATAVIGESGAGKTSLLNVLVAFEKATAGRVRRTIPGDRHALAVYWAPHTDGLWPHLTVRGHLQTVAPASMRGAIDDLLAQFDLTELSGAQPRTLSQGEKARLNAARCLAADPAVCVMDEPLVHVDAARIGGYWRAIEARLRASGASLVFATHDPAIVLLHAQRVICLEAGRVVYNGDVQTLYHDPGDRHLASRLGPFNWFEADASQRWLQLNGDRARCVRPERLHLLPDASGRFVVEAARFAGCVAEAQLRCESTDEQRLIVHRPSGPNLAPGDRVSIHMDE